MKGAIMLNLTAWQNYHWIQWYCGMLHLLASSWLRCKVRMHCRWYFCWTDERFVERLVKQLDTITTWMFFSEQCKPQPKGLFAGSAGSTSHHITSHHIISHHITSHQGDVGMVLVGLHMFERRFGRGLGQKQREPCHLEATSRSLQEEVAALRLPAVPLQQSI